MLKINHNKDRSSLGSSIQKKKPTIDYRTRIRGLENDLNNTSQNYNRTKTFNEDLRSQLNELRKTTVINEGKISDMTKALKIEEANYLRHKEAIETNLKIEETNYKKIEETFYIKKIKEGQNLLIKNSDTLAEQIKNYDLVMTGKLAKKKHLENEARDLEKSRRKIEFKWNLERRKFYEQYAEEIKQAKNYDPSSKIFEILNSEKLMQIEEMLNKIYEKTNQTSIDQLVDYFIECTKEYKNFEKHIKKVSSDLENLEKEVNELDFIINFLESNKHSHNGSNLFSEEDSQYEDLKSAGENFIHLQYQIINELYKKYSKEIFELMVTFYPDWKTQFEEHDFLDFTKMNLLYLQEKLKEAVSAMKQFYYNKQATNKSINQPAEAEIDGGKVDSQFAQEKDRISETVKNKYESKGKLFLIEEIKPTLDQIFKEK